MTVTQNKEIAQKLDRARGAMKKRDYATALDIYEELAAVGCSEAQRELATMLEAGRLLPKDDRQAGIYFKAAADSGDAYSLYRYSRYINERDKADFYIIYSASLGCEAAYSDAAEIYKRRGEELFYLYYLGLAARSGEVDALLYMVERCVATGELSEAAYYLGMLKKVPFYLRKSAKKLKGIAPAEPKTISDTERKRLLSHLACEAVKFDEPTAELTVSEMLAALGGAVEIFALGRLLYERNIDVERAVVLISAVAENGHAPALKYLGDLYLDSETERAMGYYKRAAEAGVWELYELLGDIYRDGRLISENAVMAMEMYALGASHGCEGARKKSSELIEKREGLYRRGCEAEAGGDGLVAFRSYAVSAGMGEVRAYSALGRCFELGIGARRDRKTAYKWYRAAAGCKETGAFYDLGRCYAYGIGIAFDYDEAIRNFGIAKRCGIEAAEGELIRLYENKKRHLVRQLYSSGVRLIYNKKFPAAASLLELAVGLGHVRAAYVLGCLYEFGRIGQADREGALELYRKARAAGFSDPDGSFKFRILNMSR